MKTAVAESSLAAYDELRSTGKLSQRQAQVMAVIQPGRDYSLQGLVMLCGLPINCVSGRVKELKDSGQLEHGPTRACSLTHKTIHPVRFPPRINPEQDSLFPELATA
jgi:hypothetical protein